MAQRINEIIGAYLLESKNTRQSLADAIGITRPTLDARIKGDSEWKWEEVVSLSEITGRTLNEMRDGR